MDVKEYKLTYRFLKDYMGGKKEEIITGRAFDYELKKIGLSIYRQFLMQNIAGMDPA